MNYSDEYGNWKILGKVSVTFSEKTININPSSIKLLRFTAVVDWSAWNTKWLERTYALCAFSYGLSNKNKAKSFRYYPHPVPLINEFNLINTGNLKPLGLIVKGIQQRYYKGSYFYNPLPWELQIEEYINE